MIHKPGSECGTETMVNTNEPETHLSHKPRYQFATKTMLNTYQPETYCLINHIINLSNKPC